MNRLSRFLVVVTAVSSFLFAFSQRDIETYFAGGDLDRPMLQPGEKIDDMIITTGVENAYPLSNICSPVKVNDHLIRVDCAEITFCANVAIGDTAGLMDLIPPSMDWKELVWDMSVDGHPIDLEAFGVYNVVRPDLAPSPSPVREVFKVTSLWDVVLVNPTPGTHTLQGQAQPEDGTAAYTWEVNFTVAAP